MEITGSAYTNDDLAPVTGTTLCARRVDQIAIQAPPNNGSLSATGQLTVDTAAAVGFDNQVIGIAIPLNQL